MERMAILHFILAVTVVHGAGLDINKIQSKTLSSNQPKYPKHIANSEIAQSQDGLIAKTLELEILENEPTHGVGKDPAKREALLPDKQVSRQTNSELTSESSDKTKGAPNKGSSILTIIPYGGPMPPQPIPVQPLNSVQYFGDESHVQKQEAEPQQVTNVATDQGKSIGSRQDLVDKSHDQKTRELVKQNKMKQNTFKDFDNSEINSTLVNTTVTKQRSEVPILQTFEPMTGSAQIEHSSRNASPPKASSNEPRKNPLENANSTDLPSIVTTEPSDDNNDNDTTLQLKVVDDVGSSESSPDTTQDEANENKDGCPSIKEMLDRSQIVWSTLLNTTTSTDKVSYIVEAVGQAIQDIGECIYAISSEIFSKIYPMEEPSSPDPDLSTSAFVETEPMDEAVA